jgi:hypothetical protein
MFIEPVVLLLAVRTSAQGMAWYGLWQLEEECQTPRLFLLHTVLHVACMWSEETLLGGHAGKRVCSQAGVVGWLMGWMCNSGQEQAVGVVGPRDTLACRGFPYAELHLRQWRRAELSTGTGLLLSAKVFGPPHGRRPGETFTPCQIDGILYELKKERSQILIGK